MRDADVTGVQTCALPIWRDAGYLGQRLVVETGDAAADGDELVEPGHLHQADGGVELEIGRASGRERGRRTEVAGASRSVGGSGRHRGGAARPGADCAEGR